MAKQKKGKSATKGKSAQKSKSATKSKSSQKSKSAGAPRLDSYQNVLTGIGTSNDKRQATRFAPSRQISDQQLSSLYSGNGIARRIIDVPANDATRAGVKINGDEGDAVLQQMETLGLQDKTNKGLKWARLYGAGLILINVNDGRKLIEPVDEANIKSVDSFTVFDRREAQIQQNSFNLDPRSPEFLEPEIYDLIPVTGGQTIRVHASRIMRFRGSILPRQELVANNYWDQSVFQSIYESLRQHGAVMDSGEFVIDDFTTTLIKVEGLMSHMGTVKGQKLVKSRLALFDKSRSVANTLLIDTNEDYSKTSSSVGGLPQLLDRFAVLLSGVAGIPVSKLWGRTPSGLNATGETELRFYFCDVEAIQQDILLPALEKAVKYLFLADGDEPETWSIDFNALVTPTTKEMSEVYDLNTKADVSNVNAKIMTAEAIAKHRYSGEAYNSLPPSFTKEDLIVPSDDGDEE